jgi:hypothetical protein
VASELRQQVLAVTVHESPSNLSGDMNVLPRL